MNKLKNLSYIIVIIFILLFFIDEDNDVNDNTLLVNKENEINKNYIPNDLEEINIKYANKNKFLRKEAKEHFEKLAHDANLLGYKIIAVSAYRDYDYQDKLYNNYVSTYGLEYADMCSAKAGYSEHQTGLAVDVMGSNNDYNKFSESKEFEWMKNNAHLYGFILRYPKGKENITGYKYEPWHYRYVGIDNAYKIFNNNLTLEEYKKS